MPKYLQLYGSVEEDVAIVEKNEVILMPKRNPRGLLSWVFWKDLLFDILMPKGYPHAVSDDYLSYQIWDTVQALASSMNSALATEAVLRGAGVGNQVNCLPVYKFKVLKKICYNCPAFLRMKGSFFKKVECKVHIHIFSL